MNEKPISPEGQAARKNYVQALEAHTTAKLKEQFPNIGEEVIGTLMGAIKWEISSCLEGWNEGTAEGTVKIVIEDVLGAVEETISETLKKTGTPSNKQKIEDALKQLSEKEIDPKFEERVLSAVIYELSEHVENSGTLEIVTEEKFQALVKEKGDTITIEMAPAFVLTDRTIPIIWSSDYFSYVSTKGDQLRIVTILPRRSHR